MARYVLTPYGLILDGQNSLIFVAQGGVYREEQPGTFTPVELAEGFIFNGTGRAVAGGVNATAPFDMSLDTLVEVNFKATEATLERNVFGDDQVLLALKTALVLKSTLFGSASTTALAFVVDQEHNVAMAWPPEAQATSTLEQDGVSENVMKGTLSPSDLFGIGGAAIGDNFIGHIKGLKIWDESLGGHTLLHHWPMRELEGTTFHDVVGDLDLTFDASTGTWPTPLAGGFIFNGTGQAVDPVGAANSPLRKNTAGTLEGVITVQDKVVGEDKIAFGDTDSYIGVRADLDRLTVRLFGSTTSPLILTSDGVEYETSLAWSAVDYADGTISLDDYSEAKVKSNSELTGAFGIGGTTRPGYVTFFKGTIRDVKIYDDTTGHELIHHWPLNEGVGTTFYDVVGGLDLTFDAGIGAWADPLAPRYEADLVTPEFHMAAVTLDVVQEAGGVYEGHLSTPEFSMVAVTLDKDISANNELTTPNFSMLPRDLTWTGRINYPASLSVPEFHMTAVTLDVVQEISGDYSALLSTTEFNMVAVEAFYQGSEKVALSVPEFDMVGIDIFSQGVFLGADLTTPNFDMKGGPYIYPSGAYTAELDTPEFNMVAIDPAWTYYEYLQLSTPGFNMQSNDITVQELDYPVFSTPRFDMVSTTFEHKLIIADQFEYNLAFDTIGGTYSANGLTVLADGVKIAAITTDGPQSVNFTSNNKTPGIEFKCVVLSDFVGDLDNVYLTRGHK